MLYLGPPCKGFSGVPAWGARCTSTVYEVFGRPDGCPCILFDGPSHVHLRCADCHQRLTLTVREAEGVLKRDEVRA